MPISGEAMAQRALHLGFVVHLDQHIHAEFEGGFLDSACASSSSTAGQHDQDGVGAPGARLVDLIRIEHEILAQGRQGGGRARLRQKFRRALEGRPVGQHREAGGAARFIGARQRRRIEIGADQAACDGLAFLISAISAKVPPPRMARAPPGSRAARSASRAAALISAIGTRRFASAISTRLYASILRRMSATASYPFETTDQPVEHCDRPALVDGRRGKRDALAEVRRLAGDDQSGAGIHQHRVAIGARLAFERGAQRGGVERGVAAAQLVARAARQAEWFGVKREGADLAVHEFGHLVFRRSW